MAPTLRRVRKQQHAARSHGWQQTSFLKGLQDNHSRHGNYQTQSTSQDTIQCRPNHDERKCGLPMSIDSTKTNVFPLCSVAAASPSPTKQEISESSKTCFLNESRKSYCSFRGASSLKDAMEISAGNNERAIDTDLKNSLPSSEAPETTMHRDIVLKSILSKELRMKSIPFSS